MASRPLPPKRPDDKSKPPSRIARPGVKERPAIRPPTKLRAAQIEAVKATTAQMEKAAKRIADIIRKAADNPRYMTADGKAAVERAIQAEADGLGVKLNDELRELIRKSAQIGNRDAVATIARVRDINPDTLVKFSADRALRYAEMLTPEKSPNLAAVLTNKMAESSIQALRRSLIDVFRVADVEGLTMRERNKAIQAKWRELAGGIADNEFVDVSGRPWENARYMQMLVRTTSAKVHREAFIDTNTEEGFDLARITAQGDNCPKCQAWNGVIVSLSGANKDHPSYSDALTGGVFHPNCIPGDTLVSCGGVLGAFRFRFSGDLVRIVLSGGATLRIAPNHPVLTARGWVAAKDMQHGDKVFSTTSGQRVAAGTPNVNDAPSRIDEVFMAFAKAGGVTTRQMPVSAEHFHGDAVGGQGNIDVVLSDRALLLNIESGDADSVEKLMFREADVGTRDTSGRSHFGTLLERVGLSTNRRMSGLCPRHSLLRGCVGVPSGEAFTRASYRDSCGLNDSGEAIPVDPGGLVNSEDIFSGLVSADDVLRIERERFDGHLYDLLTVAGCYLAGDEKAIAIVSNCDCYLDYIDETIGKDEIEKQAETPNVDWTDVDAVARYKAGKA